MEAKDLNTNTKTNANCIILLNGNLIIKCCRFFLVSNFFTKFEYKFPRKNAFYNDNNEFILKR